MLQGQFNTGKSEEPGINRSLVFHFVIFKQHNLYDAISAEMYKRAIGASNFATSYLHLVGCSESYNEFVENLLKITNCTLMEYNSADEFMDFAGKRNRDEFYVVDAWPSRIRIAAMLKKIKKNVILIEDYPISFERFRSSRITDRILVSPFIYKIRINRSLKIYRMVDYVISNSGTTHDFLKSKWNFASNFISFPPIHSNIFRYDATTFRDSIVMHCPSNFDSIDVASIISALKQIDFNRIWILNPKENQEKLFSIFKDKITVKRNYSFDEIKDIYSHSYLSIIPERLGTFEGPPIESLASGVPTLSNPVSSLEVVQGFLEKSGIKEMPFFSLQDFNQPNFRMWISKIQIHMPEISYIINSQFSPDSIMKEFINEISLSQKQ